MSVLTPVRGHYLDTAASSARVSASTLHRELLHTHTQLQTLVHAAATPRGATAAGREAGSYESDVGLTSPRARRVYPSLASSRVKEDAFTDTHTHARAHTHAHTHAAHGTHTHPHARGRSGTGPETYSSQRDDAFPLSTSLISEASAWGRGWGLRDATPEAAAHMLAHTHTHTHSHTHSHTHTAKNNPRMAQPGRAGGDSDGETQAADQSFVSGGRSARGRRIARSDTDTYSATHAHTHSRARTPDDDDIAATARRISDLLSQTLPSARMHAQADVFGVNAAAAMVSPVAHMRAHPGTLHTSESTYLPTAAAPPAAPAAMHQQVPATGADAVDAAVSALVAKYTRLTPHDEARGSGREAASMAATSRVIAAAEEHLQRAAAKVSPRSALPAAFSALPISSSSPNHVTSTMRVDELTQPQETGVNHDQAPATASGDVSDLPPSRDAAVPVDDFDEVAQSIAAVRKLLSTMHPNPVAPPAQASPKSAAPPTPEDAQRSALQALQAVRPHPPVKPLAGSSSSLTGKSQVHGPADAAADTSTPSPHAHAAGPAPAASQRTKRHSADSWLLQPTALGPDDNTIYEISLTPGGPADAPAARVFLSSGKSQVATRRVAHDKNRSPPAGALDRSAKPTRSPARLAQSTRRGRSAGATAYPRLAKQPRRGVSLDGPVSGPRAALVALEAALGPGLLKEEVPLAEVYVAGGRKVPVYLTGYRGATTALQRANPSATANRVPQASRLRARGRSAGKGASSDAQRNAAAFLAEQVSGAVAANEPASAANRLDVETLRARVTVALQELPVSAVTRKRIERQLEDMLHALQFALPVPAPQAAAAAAETLAELTPRSEEHQQGPDADGRAASVTSNEGTRPSRNRRRSSVHSTHAHEAAQLAAQAEATEIARESAEMEHERERRRRYSVAVANQASALHAAVLRQQNEARSAITSLPWEFQARVRAKLPSSAVDTLDLPAPRPAMAVKSPSAYSTITLREKARAEPRGRSTSNSRTGSQPASPAPGQRVSSIQHIAEALRSVEPRSLVSSSVSGERRRRSLAVAAEAQGAWAVANLTAQPEPPADTARASVPQPVRPRVTPSSRNSHPDAAAVVADAAVSEAHALYHRYLMRGMGRLGRTTSSPAPKDAATHARPRVVTSTATLPETVECPRPISGTPPPAPSPLRVRLSLGSMHPLSNNEPAPVPSYRELHELRLHLSTPSATSAAASSYSALHGRGDTLASAQHSEAPSASVRQRRRSAPATTSARAASQASPTRPRPWSASAKHRLVQQFHSGINYMLHAYAAHAVENAHAPTLIAAELAAPIAGYTTHVARQAAGRQRRQERREAYAKLGWPQRSKSRSSRSRSANRREGNSRSSDAANDGASHARAESNSEAATDGDAQGLSTGYAHLHGQGASSVQRGVAALSGSSAKQSADGDEQLHSASYASLHGRGASSPLLRGPLTSTSAASPVAEQTSYASLHAPGRSSALTADLVHSALLLGSAKPAARTTPRASQARANTRPDMEMEPSSSAYRALEHALRLADSAQQTERVAPAPDQDRPAATASSNAASLFASPLRTHFRLGSTAGRPVASGAQGGSSVAVDAQRQQQRAEPIGGTHPSDQVSAQRNAAAPLPPAGADTTRSAGHDRATLRSPTSAPISVTAYLAEHIRAGAAHTGPSAPVNATAQVPAPRAAPAPSPTPALHLSFGSSTDKSATPDISALRDTMRTTGHGAGTPLASPFAGLQSAGTTLRQAGPDASAVFLSPSPEPTARKVVSRPSAAKAATPASSAAASLLSPGEVVIPATRPAWRGRAELSETASPLGSRLVSLQPFASSETFGEDEASVGKVQLLVAGGQPHRSAALPAPDTAPSVPARRGTPHAAAKPNTRDDDESAHSATSIKRDASSARGRAGNDGRPQHAAPSTTADPTPVSTGAHVSTKASTSVLTSTLSLLRPESFTTSQPPAPTPSSTGSTTATSRDVSRGPKSPRAGHTPAVAGVRNPPNSSPTEDDSSGDFGGSFGPDALFAAVARMSFQQGTVVGQRAKK